MFCCWQTFRWWWLALHECRLKSLPMGNRKSMSISTACVGQVLWSSPHRDSDWCTFFRPHVIGCEVEVTSVTICCFCFFDPIYLIVDGFAFTWVCNVTQRLRLLDRSWQMNNTTLLCQSSSNLNWSEDNFTASATGWWNDYSPVALKAAVTPSQRLGFLSASCMTQGLSWLSIARTRSSGWNCSAVAAILWFLGASSEIIIKLANGSMDSSTGRWQWWFMNFSRTKLQQIR